MKVSKLRAQFVRLVPCASTKCHLMRGTSLQMLWAGAVLGPGKESMRRRGSQASILMIGFSDLGISVDLVVYVWMAVIISW